MALPVVVTPSVPAPPPRAEKPELWHGLTSAWTGVDGSVWPLTDSSAGVYLTADGVIGMGHPSGQRFTSSSPVVHGSTFRGWIANERSCFWPLFLFSDASSEEWLSRNAAFWRSLSPSATGTWTVSQPTGEARSLRCRLDDDGSAAYDHDPAFHGWSIYGVRLVAEQPFWEGEPEKRTWRAPRAVQFFSTPADSYVFAISASGGFGNATIANSGDVDAYPVWTITGPVPGGTSVGVGGDVIEVPFEVAAGDTVTLDSHPDRLTAVTNDGEDVTDRLGRADWVSVPPGSSVPLAIAMDGAGEGASVEVALTPLFYRAF